LTAKFLRELADVFENGARKGSLTSIALPSKWIRNRSPEILSGNNDVLEKISLKMLRE